MAESEGVRNFHLNSDVDSSKFAQHHTIGTKYGQAAPGEQFASLKRDFEELQQEFDSVTNDYIVVAAYTSVDGNTGSGAWNGVSGYDQAMPGFASTLVKAPAGQSIGNNDFAEYGLGIITAQQDIYIDVNFYLELANSSVGRRGIRISLDGTDSNVPGNMSNFQAAVAAGPMRLAAVWNGPLAAGHDLRLQVFQDTGAALAITYRQLMYKAIPL